MEFIDDIGKFVTLSYKRPDGSSKTVFGKLEIDEDGMLKFINVKNPDNKPKVVNPNEIIIIDYSAVPVEVKNDL